jgi:hypothetical protein
MVTSCLPCLSEINDLVRPLGEKQVSIEWLNQIGVAGLAWWFCDDGELSKNQHGVLSARFHTEGFGRDGSEIVASWLESRYGATSLYHHKQSHWLVALSSHGTRAFIGEIQRHVPKCMRYKLGEGHRDLRLF